MYKLGTKVAYPMHGVGTVDRIEERTVLGESKQYFVMKLSVTDMTLMVPVDKAEELGLRQVATEDIITRVLGVLREEPDPMKEDWKLRYNEHLEKMKRGALTELAEVVRNLFRRNATKDLSTSEKKIFETAFQLVIEEIALARGAAKVEVEDLITVTLQDGLQFHTAKLSASQ